MTVNCVLTVTPATGDTTAIRRLNGRRCVRRCGEVRGVREHVPAGGPGAGVGAAGRAGGGGLRRLPRPDHVAAPPRVAAAARARGRPFGSDELLRRGLVRLDGDVRGGL